MTGVVMGLEREKLVKAKEILQKMAVGVNPLNGSQIEDGSFLHDARIIRCLYFVQDVMQIAIETQLRTSAKKPEKFIITGEEKSRVQLPQGRIGVNEFARCLNKVIDLNRSKKLSGIEINRKLKRMGILGEEASADGKTKTVLTARSSEYGIETEKRNYNGNEYEMILFNDVGKKFLMENLENIMTFNEQFKASPANP